MTPVRNSGVIVRVILAHLAASQITNRPQLARNYLSGWFAIDLVSIAPFDSVGCAFRSEDVRRGRYHFHSL